jgi:glycoprotein-N-acetylgalactosamine 3-beta-galactosyltransferase
VSGGATYVLNREALKRVVEEGYRKNRCTTKGKYEDVEVGKCLNVAGVQTHETRDVFGRETFHPLHPQVHVIGPIPENQKPQDRFEMVAGTECCSELTVSFHKVDPKLMVLMDHLLYRTTVYGRIPDTNALNLLAQPSVVPPLANNK